MNSAQLSEARHICGTAKHKFRFIGMKIMNESNDNKNGYLYILEVKDIDLPVCKIGMTSRSPHARCSEINKNSTGDFIWQVAYQIAVDDCQKLESLVHKKLVLS
jgi:hypothetical protein